MKWTQKPKSKWFNFDLYPYDTCPDYASRPGYFLGRKVIDCIHTTTGFTFFCTNLNSTELTDTMNCTPKQAIWDYFLCERCWCGIWTQHMDNIDRVNLNVLAYQNGCVDGPDLIHVNPVNNDEIDQLEQFVKQRNMHVNNFKPQECQQHACLCYSELPECELVTAKHWSDFSNEDHVGVIPRLLQHSWSHIGSDVSGSRVRSWHKVTKQNAETSYSLGIFQNKVEMYVQLVVFLLFDYWTVYTPHIILNTFEKRAMDVEL